MPKKSKELTALAVSKLKAPGKHPVGGVDGLRLRISESGWKAWVLRVQVGNTAVRREITLGSFPHLSLAEAREKAYELRKQVKSGFDPAQERKAAKVEAQIAAAKDKTFEECANAFIDANAISWKNYKHTQQWRNTMEKYVRPIIGKLPVSVINTDLVLKVLQQVEKNASGTLWNTKTETATRIRGRIEKILDWAAFRGYRTGENPARWKGHLEHELPQKEKIQKTRNQPALPYDQISGFIGAVRVRQGVAARAVVFGILTAVRSNEVRGMRWEEVDLTKGLWTIPAKRMKMDREHRVPLCDETLHILTDMRKTVDEMIDKAKAKGRVIRSDFVFPNNTGGQLSDMALTKVIRDMHDYRLGKEGKGWCDRFGNRITMHGFRSTFRDWAGETTSYPREVCEHALAHRLADGVEAAYQRGDMLAKRSEMMADWARYCYSNRSA